jgi:hypothetical protein
MTDRPMVFIDDGGVMNDHNERGLQGQRQVGEYFVPLLGGQSDAWSRANRVGACRLFEPVPREMSGYAFSFSWAPRSLRIVLPTRSATRW